VATACKEYIDLEYVLRLDEKEARTLRDILSVSGSDDIDEVCRIFSIIQALDDVGMKYRTAKPGTVHLYLQR